MPRFYLLFLIFGYRKKKRESRKVREGIVIFGSGNSNGNGNGNSSGNGNSNSSRSCVYFSRVSLCVDLCNGNGNMTKEKKARNRLTKEKKALFKKRRLYLAYLREIRVK